MPKPHIIYIQPEAPTKPSVGAACNGCGLCCLLEPCPVGMLVSRRMRGTCKALLWSQDQRCYLCGMLSAPERFVPLTGPRMQAWVSRLVRRMISTDLGCDAELQAQAPAKPGTADPDTRA